MTDHKPDTVDDEVRHLLRTEALSHQTDLTRILARIDDGLASGAPAGAPDIRGDRIGSSIRRLPVRGAVVWASLAAAAAIVVAIALPGDRDVQVDSADRRPEITTPTTTADSDVTAAPSSVPGPSSSDPTATTGTTRAPGTASSGGSAATGTPTSGGSAPSGPATTGHASSGPSTTGSATTRPATTSGQAPAPDQPASTTTTTTMPAAPATPAAVEDLPSELLLDADWSDWLVTGARNDGQTVRLKDGPAAIRVTAPSGSAPASAPIDIHWQDGYPEQDRQANDRWLSAPTGAEITVTVKGSTGFSRIALYCGGTGAVTATVTLSGLRATTVDLPPGDDSPATAGVIVVDLDSEAQGRDLTVRLRPAGQARAAIGAVAAS